MTIFEAAERAVDGIAQLQRRWPDAWDCAIEKADQVTHPDDRRDPYEWIDDASWPPDPDTEVV